MSTEANRPGPIIGYDTLDSLPWVSRRASAIKFTWTPLQERARRYGAKKRFGESGAPAEKEYEFPVLNWANGKLE